jgi:hypothetical protein
MRLRFSLRGISGVALLGVLAALAYGQVNLATVTGLVSDTVEAVMPGVDITIRNVDTNIERKVQRGGLLHDHEPASGDL